MLCMTGIRRDHFWEMRNRSYKKKKVILKAMDRGENDSFSSQITTKPLHSSWYFRPTHLSLLDISQKNSNFTWNKLDLSEDSGSDA